MDKPELLNSFVDVLSSEFDGKVSVGTFEDQKGFRLTLTLNEGEELTEEQQKTFDFVNGLNTAENDFKIGLTDNEFSDVDKGNFFETNLTSNSGEEFNVGFNVGLLNSAGDKGALMDAGKVVLFGVTQGNQQKFKSITGLEISSYSQANPRLGNILYGHDKFSTKFNLGSQGSIKYIVSGNNIQRVKTTGLIQ